MRLLPLHWLCKLADGRPRVDQQFVLKDQQMPAVISGVCLQHHQPTQNDCHPLWAVGVSSKHSMEPDTGRVRELRGMDPFPRCVRGSSTAEFSWRWRRLREVPLLSPYACLDLHIVILTTSVIDWDMTMERLVYARCRSSSPPARQTRTRGQPGSSGQGMGLSDLVKHVVE